jgi:hypothetical protein
MSSPMNRLLSTAIASTCALLAVGCGSGPETLDEVQPETWIDNPVMVEGVMAATGMAKILGNEANARTRAEADGRAKLAATARAQMQQLISNWAKETGDLLNDSTVSSLLNDETLIRQVTDVELIGARPAKYVKREGNQYVLVVMDDPAEWTKRVGAGMRSRVLQDQTMFKTEVLKRDFEEKLDKLINRDAEAAAKAIERVTEQPPEKAPDKQ